MLSRTGQVPLPAPKLLSDSKASKFGWGTLPITFASPEGQWKEPIRNLGADTEIDTGSRRAVEMMALMRPGQFL